MREVRKERSPSRWREPNHRSHDRRMATPWNLFLVITFPRKGNLQQCQNYQTIGLISYPSKVMLKITLNKLKPQAEKIIAEEKAGSRARRSTKEQIFNLRILCEKYL